MNVGNVLEQFSAWVGIDWADKKHAFSLVSAEAGAKVGGPCAVVGRLEPPFDRPGGRQLVYLLLIARGIAG